MRALPLICRRLSSGCVLSRRGAEKARVPSSPCKGTSSIMAGGTPLTASKPSYLPKAPPLNTVILELQPMDLRRTQNLVHSRVILGLPWWLSGKGLACQGRRCRFDPWAGKIPWRGKWQPTPVFLPGHPLDRGAWWATVHGVTKEPDTV